MGVLLLTVRAKHPGGAEHVDGVARLSRALAERLGSREAAGPEAEAALLLHEIGTIGIADSLLQKAGPLTTAEMETVQTHAVVGAEILRPLDGMAAAALLAETHHERWDGSGYPRRLAGNDIPELARIVAVANTYVALTSNRPYRSAVGHEVAVAEIALEAGHQFDPAVAAALAEMPAPSDGPGLRIIPARS